MEFVFFQSNSCIIKYSLKLIHLYTLHIPEIYYVKEATHSVVVGSVRRFQRVFNQNVSGDLK